MTVYTIAKEIKNHPELGKYTSYGITVYDCKENIRKQITYIPDVFTDIALAEKVIELCNKEQLDPVHLPELIEDVLLSATI